MKEKWVLKLSAAISLAAMIALPSTLWAKRGDVRVWTIKDPNLAELSLRVLEDGEPAQLPYEMSMSVLCVDNRLSPDKEKPKVINVTLGTDQLPHDRICDFRAFNFDDKSKVLTIQYSTSTIKPGPSECDANWSRSFDLNEMCARWRP